MRILVLTFYFQPDLCAGSFRTTALVNALGQQAAADDMIDVITTLPNRYSSLNAFAPKEEVSKQVRIRRIALPRHESGMIDQSKAFLRFAAEAWKLTRGERYDLVFASSSRLFTAFLGACIATRARTRYYADIRDIFTDSIGDVLDRKSPFRALLPIFRTIERFTIRRADVVNLVSEGFRDHFERIDPRKDYRLFTNGIDEEFLARSYEKPEEPGPIRILYAGNIGSGQGLDCIVPQAARLLGNNYEFIVIGDGGARKRLEAAIDTYGVPNVKLLRPVSREELMEWYAKADILFLHLNEHRAFQKVLPSKIFEYAATGKPVLAGVSGYAAEFLREHVPNSAVFEPCDAKGCIRGLQSLEMSITPRTSFICRFRRETIMRLMAQDVLRAVAK